MSMKETRNCKISKAFIGDLHRDTSHGRLSRGTSTRAFSKDNSDK